MRKQTVVKNKIDSPDNWNSVVLSLANGGGFIISEGKMAEIHICCPKMNIDTLVLENKFLTYWIDIKLLAELYQEVFRQQDELIVHQEDIEEQKKIELERDKAVLAYKKSKNNKKNSKIIIEDVDPEISDHIEHEVE